MKSRPLPGSSGRKTSRQAGEFEKSGELKACFHLPRKPMCPIMGHSRMWIIHISFTPEPMRESVGIWVAAAGFLSFGVGNTSAVSDRDLRLSDREAIVRDRIPCGKSSRAATVASPRTSCPCDAGASDGISGTGRVGPGEGIGRPHRRTCPQGRVGPRSGRGAARGVQRMRKPIPPDRRSS